ncbi:MAG: ACP S-malonyltransferase [Acutalibacter sp.]|nr:ACP S-malonyltransferase [Acutalibacter sp.]
MGKIAFVFSGQGAQYPGMGQSLAQCGPAARAVFDLADSLRPGTSAQCFSGTAEELSITKNTQPCLYCVDLAAAKALEEGGVRPDFAAGFSLGEVAAVTFGGILSEQAGFDFVCKRAAAMDEAARQNPGSMAAVLKLSNEAVEALCKEFTQVWPVNYNCPGQLVVAGEKEQLAAFQQKVKEAGGRAAPLAVSGGFHSPFMESAAQELDKALAEMSFAPARLPIYANLSAQPYGDDPRALLVSQVKSPVRWQETIENLAGEGVDTFFECGPGKTLCGLIKKTVKTAQVFQVQDEETLKTALAAL